jgi:hypothetical protein
MYKEGDRRWIGLDYPARLRKLKLQSLVYRRQRRDMIQTKMFLTSDSPPSYLQLDTKQKTRGHSMKRFQMRAQIHTANHFSSNRIMSYWNSDWWNSNIPYNQFLQIWSWLWLADATMEDRLGCSLGLQV